MSQSQKEFRRAFKEIAGKYSASVQAVLWKYFATVYDDNDKPRLAVTNNDVLILLAEIDRLAAEVDSLRAPAEACSNM